MLSSNGEPQRNADTRATDGESHQPDSALQRSTRAPLSSLRGDIISLVPSATDRLVLDDGTGDKENINPDGRDFGGVSGTMGLENLQISDSPCSPFQEISNPTTDQPRLTRRRTADFNRANGVVCLLEATPHAHNCCTLSSAVGKRTSSPGQFT